MPPKRKLDQQETEAVEGRLVRALGHPLRARALSIFNERTCSPKEIADQLDVPVNKLSYHVNVLKRCECIELVTTAQRRGATEHYYRGTTRSFFNDEIWGQLSAAAKDGISVAGLKMTLDAAQAAVVAETFDSRPDRHLSCTPVVLDDHGWGEVAEVLSTALNRVIEIQAESAERLANEGETGIPATVAILGFESAPPEPKAPPA
jgi:DNA-binding transcriptional ArsR family regulator